MIPARALLGKMTDLPAAQSKLEVAARARRPARPMRSDAHFVLYWFRRDCEILGLRQRGQYRRTFISLALADGARKDILRWITQLN
jgi:hypothetical protein